MHFSKLYICVCLIVMSSSVAFSLSVSPPFADLGYVIVGQTYDVGLIVQGRYTVEHNCPAKISDDLLLTVPKDARSELTQCTLYLTDLNTALAIPVTYNVNRSVLHNVSWNISLQPTSQLQSIQASIILKNTGNVREEVNISVQNVTILQTNISARQSATFHIQIEHLYEQGIHELPVTICSYECITENFYVSILSPQKEVELRIENKSHAINIFITNPSQLTATIKISEYSNQKLLSNTTVLVPSNKSLTKTIIPDMKTTTILIEQDDNLLARYDIHKQQSFLTEKLRDIPWFKILGIIACIIMTVIILKKK